MNLIPDRIGGNPKQLAWLGGLVVVLGVVYFMQRTPDSPAATPTTATVKTPMPISRQQAVSEAASSPKTVTRSGKGKDENFRPSIKVPEGTDITKIDPTLKLELLAKLQKVPLAGGSRSVFDYGQAPVPPPPPVAPIRPPNGLDPTNRPPEVIIPAGNVKPPPPPIPLKFYGYANRLSGRARQAFFLDGDDIQIKGENDVIRGRYKIIRIGINSAVVEDLTSHDQQTLQLVAELNS
jgi:hypothetical protein